MCCFKKRRTSSVLVCVVCECQLSCRGVCETTLGPNVLERMCNIVLSSRTFQNMCALFAGLRALPRVRPVGFYVSGSCREWPGTLQTRTRAVGVQGYRSVSVSHPRRRRRGKRDRERIMVAGNGSALAPSRSNALSDCIRFASYNIGAQEQQSFQGSKQSPRKPKWRRRRCRWHR